MFDSGFYSHYCNPRESCSITDVCTLMEPTPDSGVSCALMVVVMKASMMAVTVPALTALMALIRGAGQTLPEASRIPYGARKKS
ncbi:hypothetical protein GOBAR_AA02510 [Gossypium barbadense]|uniref:Uncharacterized protein n=1 Tax=Gossypium barbadense TaxID=3634 RepID=A0A2P5YR32_GOSBA|nr:hypothetical protein GOBAR_AA02510 [Gossypium barbadense]